MTHPIFQKVDAAKLPMSILSDIQEYCLESKQPLPETVYDALHCYLMWNGIIGYTTDIATIFQAQED